LNTYCADWSNHSPITAQSLPSWNDYLNSYPKTGNKWMTGADNIFNFVGGDVLQLRKDYPSLTNNPCALKVSIALNGAGVSIPHIWSDNNSNGIQESNEPNMTYVGGDGKYYFVRAEFLIKYMLEVFPDPMEITNKQIRDGLTPEEAFGTDHGIYAMYPNNPVTFQASGHCDIFNYEFKRKCAAGCNWDKTRTKLVYIWKLY
jgi:hypothetical protein